MKSTSKSWFRIVRGTLALGLVVGVGGVATAASFTDFSNVNAQETGIGSPKPFDLALVRNDIVVQADTQDGVAWSIGGVGQDALLPGHKLETDIPVLNNTQSLRAEVVLTIEALDNGSSGLVSDPSSLYRFSGSDAATGQVIFGSPQDPERGLSLSEIGAVDLGTFAARGSSPLTDGAAWVPGDPGSHRSIRLTVAYPDSVESEQFNGSIARLRVNFKAGSTI